MHYLECTLYILLINFRTIKSQEVLWAVRTQSLESLDVFQGLTCAVYNGVCAHRSLREIHSCWEGLGRGTEPVTHTVTPPAEVVRAVPLLGYRSAAVW